MSSSVKTLSLLKLLTLEQKLRWLKTTPFGFPVVPEVYISEALSSGESSGKLMLPGIVLFFIWVKFVTLACFSSVAGGSITIIFLNPNF